MTDLKPVLEFTGERLVPDDPAHRDLYWEHVARYQLAVPWAAGKRILDLGCGCGYGAHALARAGAQTVLGIDLAPAAIEYATAHYAQKNLAFQTGDVRDTRLSDASFDLIVCFELIEHVREQDAVIAEARRLLAPGGLFVCSTPDARRPGAVENPFHAHELEREEFRSLLATHFPAVRLLGQRRMAGLAFEQLDGPGDGAAISHELAAGEPSDYYLALCGETLPDAARIVEIPYFRNIDELRDQLRRRDDDVSARDERIVALQREVDEKNDWLQTLSTQREELEHQVQDRDVRLELAARERNELRAGWGHRLQRLMTPVIERLRRWGKSLVRATFFLGGILLSLPLLILHGLSFIPRLMHAARAWRIARHLPTILLSVSPASAEAMVDKPREGAPPGVSVVIPSFNGMELLREHLPSVLAEQARCAFPVEIIVVEDGGSDETCAWLAREHPQVKIIERATNGGFAVAANEGVAAAQHPIVYLLNNDMQLLPGALEHAACTLWRTGVFAVTGAIAMAETRKTGIETGLAVADWHDGFVHLRHCDDLGDQPRSTLYAGGGSTAYDRDAFLRLGGFAALYAPFYAEDLDLSYRAWKAGRRVLVEPRSRVIHRHRATIGRVADERKIETTLQRNLLLCTWANLTDAEMLREHARAITRAVLRGRVSIEALRAAWAKKDELLHTRRRPAGDVLTDREILTGAGSRVWDRLRAEGPRASSTVNKKLKVLAIAPYCPYPPTHGGAVRMWELLTRMAARHEVHLAAMVEREAELAHADELRKHFPRVYLHLRGPADAAPHWWPASVAEFRSQAFERAVDRLCGEEDYDLVQAEYPILAHALPFGGRAKTVLTEIDVYHVAYRRAAWAVDGWEQKILSTYEWLRMFRYEAEHADRADLLLAMSEVDAAACRRLTRTPVAVAPNGVDPARIAFQPRPPRAHEVLFVGHFRHTPNVDGIVWFAREVWPRIRDAHWPARLLIAGAAPPPRVQALAHDPTIQVLGFVDDLSPLYRRAACFVTPIRRGSGTRLKIIEAMAAGTPVLSTAVGAEGLNARHDEHLLLADDPEALAAHCLRLLNDHALGERLALAARQLVEREYNWEAIADRLEAAWREVLR
ncbi:MAG TPA: glycosyltransferase [bacterium]|nr:glycosyltransferase [bacterium]